MEPTVFQWVRYKIIDGWRRLGLKFLPLESLTFGETLLNRGGLAHPDIFSNTFPKSILFPITPLKRSPVFFSLSNIVVMVNSEGLNPLCTSSHCNGAETVAPALGLKLYAQASVCPLLFCK